MCDADAWAAASLVETSASLANTLNARAWDVVEVYRNEGGGVDIDAAAATATKENGAVVLISCVLQVVPCLEHDNDNNNNNKTTTTTTKQDNNNKDKHKDKKTTTTIKQWCWFLLQTRS